MATVEETADQFVKNLLTQGAEIPCDDSVDTFKKNNDLPPFYDEELFKKGQEFYHRNIFAVFSAKVFGLIAVIAIPTILKILVHTKMSGSEYTAYKRYVATIFHMTVWYDTDFKPGSKLWQSIKEVKNLHNSASKKGCKAGLNRINQKDMALTQFGFMGFQLIRSKHFALENVTTEEWKAFIHLWRVIGYILGIEDRFNICRESVAETKEICERLLNQAFLPHVKSRDPEFIQMTKYLIGGLWTIQPLLNFNVAMYTMDLLLANSTKMIDYENENFKKMTFVEKGILFFVALILVSLKWAPFRWYHNHTRYRDLWLMRNFPFLAYYKFGYRNSHVSILGKNS